MFSLFKGGISNTKSSDFVDLNWVIEYIKNNPQSDLIKKIRYLKSHNEVLYKKLKKKLSYITPNCKLWNRSIATKSEFENNYISDSGYIYIDIDDCSDIIEYKEHFIKKYGDLASLISVSPGGEGLSILFRISHKIKSKDEFLVVWDYITSNILSDESPDPNTRDLGRAMFLTYDTAPFYNHNNILTIPNFEIVTNTKDKNIHSSVYPYEEYNNTLEYTISSLPDIDIVIKKIITKTRIEVLNPIVDFNSIQYVRISYPNIIKDGLKHKVFATIIHKLVYLNPDLDIKYLFAYINFINNNNTTIKMAFRELSRHFQYTYNLTQGKNYKFNKFKLKHFHINPNASLTKKEKSNLMNKLNGLFKKNKSISKINEAKKLIIANGEKVTKIKVSRVTGLSISTIRKYFTLNVIDIEALIIDLNKK